jgi:hypothetical protein
VPPVAFECFVSRLPQSPPLPQGEVGLMVDPPIGFTAGATGFYDDHFVAHCKVCLCSLALEMVKRNQIKAAARWSDICPI